GRGRDFSAPQHGPEIIAKNEPVGFNRFVRVKRMFARRRFTPAHAAVRISFDQKDSPMLGAAKTGYKRRDKPEVNFAEREFAQEHFPSDASQPVGASGRCNPAIVADGSRK